MMKPLPKPKHCGQQWLDMNPADGGRICRQCTKLIIDFTKMNWAEIETIQRENNNSVCGMYSPKQLEHWGHEVPKNTSSKIAAAALFLSLNAAGPVLAQNTSADSSTKTIIHGVISGQFSPTMGISWRQPSVSIKGTSIEADADSTGKYEFDITNYIDTIPNPTLVFSMIGYENLEYEIGNNRGNIEYDAKLNADEDEIIYFYIDAPSHKQSFMQKIKNVFRRKV